MAARERRYPGPDHPITVESNPARVVVKLGGKVIADSTNTLTLREASYPPVHYIPRTDADISMLEPTDHHTYCPYKGEASYYSIRAGGEGAKNAVWSYEEPYEAVGPIRGYLAFYPDRVDSIEETAAPAAGQF
ncbi:DUF427 domain-containing protein [Rhizobium sp. LCM 4573]|uniref:DUF427 domain-containing protein n=1 Tax=Rhizobium sp. LCM 4573 TaxID=1848291 RepID=UPI0008DA7540|nr:DUF427 domain-containing protein [Rhizobium sp. LCM 4573]OHV84275.1 hypothetical protein LCM4573_00845 [Rhizobium sp. LCM 4573]